MYKTRRKTKEDLGLPLGNSRSSGRVQVILTPGRRGQDGPLREYLVDSGCHPTSLRKLRRTGPPAQLQGPGGHSTMGSLTCSPHFQWEASLPGKRSGCTANRGGTPPPPVCDPTPKQVPEPHLPQSGDDPGGVQKRETLLGRHPLHPFTPAGALPQGGQTRAQPDLTGLLLEVQGHPAPGGATAEQS